MFEISKIRVSIVFMTHLDLSRLFLSHDRILFDNWNISKKSIFCKLFIFFGDLRIDFYRHYAIFNLMLSLSQHLICQTLQEKGISILGTHHNDHLISLNSSSILSHLIQGQSFLQIIVIMM